MGFSQILEDFILAIREDVSWFDYIQQNDAVIKQITSCNRMDESGFGPCNVTTRDLLAGTEE